MRRHRVGTSLYAGVLFVVLGTLAWASGQPFIFPSLGPSAFILAFQRTGDRAGLGSVVVSHLIGGVAGLLAYSLLAGGVSLVADPTAFSTGGLRLVASATLSLVVTSWGMIATDTVHARPVRRRSSSRWGCSRRRCRSQSSSSVSVPSSRSTRSCCPRTTGLLLRPGQARSTADVVTRLY